MVGTQTTQNTERRGICERRLVVQFWGSDAVNELPARPCGERNWLLRYTCDRPRSHSCAGCAGRKRACRLARTRCAAQWAEKSCFTSPRTLNYCGLELLEGAVCAGPSNNEYQHAGENGSCDAAAEPSGAAMASRSPATRPRRSTPSGAPIT